MNVEKYIAEGNLELFVLDLLAANESLEAERLLAKYDMLGEELERLLILLETFLSGVSLAWSSKTDDAMREALDFSTKRARESDFGPPPLEDCHELDRWLDYTIPFIDRQHRNGTRSYDILSFNEHMQQLLFRSCEAFDWTLHTDQTESFLILAGEVELRMEGTTRKLFRGSYFVCSRNSPQQLLVTSPNILLVLQRRFHWHMAP